MINGLQMIIYLPLFRVNMPANAKYFYSMIVEIIDFEILPSNWIRTDLFELKEGEPFSQDFKLMKFKNYSLIYSRAEEFFVLCIICGVTVIMLSFKPLAMKF